MSWHPARRSCLRYELSLLCLPCLLEFKFFRASSAALNLIESSAYLKIGSYKEIFSFNLTVYLPSVRKITVSNRSIFSLPPFTSFSTFQWCLCSTQISLPLLQRPFFEERTFPVWFKTFLIAVFKLYRIPRTSARRTTALIRGRRLLTFLSQMRHLFEGGAYSSKYGTLKLLLPTLILIENHEFTVYSFMLSLITFGCCKPPPPWNFQWPSMGWVYAVDIFWKCLFLSTFSVSLLFNFLGLT